MGSSLSTEASTTKVPPFVRYAAASLQKELGGDALIHFDDSAGKVDISIMCDATLHYDAETDEMDASIVSDAVRAELRDFVLCSVRASAAASDAAVNATLGVRPTLVGSGGLEHQYTMPQCLAVMYPSGPDGQTPPSIIINYRPVAGHEQDGWADNTRIMAENPGIQTMARLDFRGFNDMPRTPTRETDLERHILRIAELSEILIWTRDEDGHVTTSAETPKEDGELRLRILGNNNKDIVIKHAEILDVIRAAVPRAPTSNVPANTLRLLASHGHLAENRTSARGFSGLGIAAGLGIATGLIAARAAKRLNPGGTTCRTSARRHKAGGANPNAVISRA